MLVFCENKKIANVDNDRYIALYLALEESLFAFYEAIKSFIVEDKDPAIIKSEDEREPNLNYIPKVYWKIWKLEFLLRIKYSDKDLEQKLTDIVDYYYEFDFPEDWLSFIYFQPQNNESSSSKLYAAFESYIENLEKDFK